MAKRDLTKGPIGRSLLLFALPVLGSGVVQQLYSTVDLLFVGNVLGTHATASLGISTLLVTCVIGLFMGISVGANVVVGRLFGSGDLGAVSRATSTALSFGLLFGIALAVAGFLLADPFVGWMGTPPESAAGASVYLHLYFVAMPSVMLYNMLAAIYRAFGDSVTPLAAQLAGGLLNIACNWLVLCVAGMGIAGVALATLASNVFASAILTARARRLGPGFKAGWLPRGIDRPLLAQMLRIGVPMGIQSFVITLSNVFVQYQVDILGASAMAAFAAYLKVELPIYLSIVSMGTAVTTFVAQNSGAGEELRCRRGILVCQVACLALTAALSAAMLLVGRWAFWIFDHDPEVIATGLAMAGITFPFYVAYAVLEVQGDALRGYGRSSGPSAIILANICLLRIVLLLAFNAGGPTVVGIAATYPVTWATAALSMVVYRIVVLGRAKA